ncbi:MAG: hypothetical protein KA369_12360 [Spirochaetes bacterium]|nr:hypothetical protein [Spirochaetota bacterium]
MAIQKVNENLMTRGPIDAMKRQGNEIAKPEAEKKTQSQLQGFKEANKGFSIDTKA